MVATSASRDAENAADFQPWSRRPWASRPKSSPATGGAAVVHRRHPWCRGRSRHALSRRRHRRRLDRVRHRHRHGRARDQRRHRMRTDDRAAPRTTIRRRAAQIAAATADITAAVDRALLAVPGKNAATLIGLAGSVTTVTAHRARSGPPTIRTRIHGARVSYEQVAAGDRATAGDDTAQRLKIGVMHPGRADVIGAGALVLRTHHGTGRLHRTRWRRRRERARHSRRHRLVDRLSSPTL